MIVKILRINKIIDLHESLIRETGGISGFMNMNLLESALAAPFASFEGVYFYKTVKEQAARLAYGIIKNHPFIDGNKRIGILAMLTFLKENGIILNCSDDDLVRLGLSIAGGTFDVKDILEFIINHEI
ncbi:MAG: type II toxin-antitoxin system death-on-curing family toxin [Oscillospiraceae bacterium]|nr:type II toxin-antitoxin system death-on-curing family toxin [Oscillospiraceae bacterium]